MASFNAITASNVIGGGGSGGSSYLVYTALLTQTGTNAPVATVLENTTGNTVVWQRVDVGDYYTNSIISPVIPGFNYNPDPAAGTTYMPVSDGLGTITGYWYINSDGNQIQFKTFDSLFNPVDMNTIFGTGSICLPEIRVYP